MKYTMEQRMQIMAITDPEYTHVFEFENMVFITEGHYGCYIQKQDLKIKIDKLVKLAKSGLHPDDLKAVTHLAALTNNYYRSPYKKDFAIQIKSQAGNKAWINFTWYKRFGENIKLRMSDGKSAVLVLDLKDNPLGIILPININEEAENA